jgi:LDH2 family malate/lactate/ureidoglycolate dehydrogenase
VPGEPEARAAAARRATGIFVEDETWGQIQACII